WNRVARVRLIEDAAGFVVDLRQGSNLSPVGWEQRLLEVVACQLPVRERLDQPADVVIERVRRHHAEGASRLFNHLRHAVEDGLLKVPVLFSLLSESRTIGSVLPCGLLLAAFSFAVQVRDNPPKGLADRFRKRLRDLQSRLAFVEELQSRTDQVK